MHPAAAALSSRIASATDFDAALDTLVTAFAADPVWGGWAFPDPAAATLQRRTLFGLWLREGLAHEAVHITTHGEAVALWYPPGATEDSEDHERRLVGLAASLGTHASAFMQGCALFTASYPPGRYWYLALLAARGDVRGQGWGMGLLRHCLALPEFHGLPVYLESTLATNTRRYEEHGFRRIGEFTLPAGGPAVNRMWREPEN